jgi:hypothetical protein
VVQRLGCGEALGGVESQQAAQQIYTQRRDVGELVSQVVIDVGRETSDCTRAAEFAEAGPNLLIWRACELGWGGSLLYTELRSNWPKIGSELNALKSERGHIEIASMFFTEYRAQICMHLGCFDAFARISEHLHRKFALASSNAIRCKRRVKSKKEDEGREKMRT